MNTSNDTSVHTDGDFDLSNTDRGVWQVKVPKYIANKWDKATDDSQIGSLKISNVRGHVPQVTLSLSESLSLTEPEDENPEEFKLDVSCETRQSLMVFSH
jgi:hypothetical protein